MDDQRSSTGADLLARKRSRLAAGNTDSGIDLHIMVFALSCYGSAFDSEVSPDGR